jgi:hypothetical protein
LELKNYFSLFDEFLPCTKLSIKDVGTSTGGFFLSTMAFAKKAGTKMTRTSTSRSEQT